ncbi:MAG: hypothetical protein KF900_11745 [Bacteroidetes bacterium]|nr:hypothetical protein [Bacteroidota bacterium]
MAEETTGTEPTTKTDVQVSTNEQGGITVTVTSEGAKITKADAGRSLTEETYAIVKITYDQNSEKPSIDISQGSKLTKADAG